MSQPASGNFACPYCSQAVEVSASDEPVEWACPHCGRTFVIDESSEPRDDDRRRDDELDSARIRQLSHARRSAYRARSFCLIGALFCAVGCIQLTINIVADVNRGEFGWLTGVLAIVDALMLWGTFYLIRAATRLGAEARRSAILPAGCPPDFSTLCDGTQRFKDLEELK